MSIIDKGSGVVTLINVFTVAPENQQKLVDMLIEATQRTMGHMPGFVSANIHRSGDGMRVVNYAQWESKEAFETMAKDPRAQKHMAPVSEIATADFHLYEVVDTFSK
jgi:heme-degrading monooxygenase HmoA